jgi:hypothetical protein
VNGHVRRGEHACDLSAWSTAAVHEAGSTDRFLNLPDAPHSGSTNSGRRDCATGCEPSRAGPMQPTRSAQHGTLWPQVLQRATPNPNAYSFCGLTFDLSGETRAQPLARPLEGMVRFMRRRHYLPLNSFGCNHFVESAIPIACIKDSIAIGVDLRHRQLSELEVFNPKREPCRRVHELRRGRHPVLVV